MRTYYILLKFLFGSFYTQLASCNVIIILPRALELLIHIRDLDWLWHFGRWFDSSIQQQNNPKKSKYYFCQNETKSNMSVSTTLKNSILVWILISHSVPVMLNHYWLNWCLKKKNQTEVLISMVSTQRAQSLSAVTVIFLIFLASGHNKTRRPV